MTALGHNPQSRLKHIPQPDQRSLLAADEEQFRLQAPDKFSNRETTAVKVVPTVPNSNLPRCLPRLPELDRRLSDIGLITPSEGLFEPER